MPHSHHSHSGQFCSHAVSKLEEVLQRASILGFTHFHLSEHVPRKNKSELYPEEIEAKVTPDKLLSTFEAYLEEARRLQQSYNGKGKGKMQVLVGCETENINSQETLDFLTEVLGSTPETRPEEIGKGKVDYIVGSLHHSNSIPIDFDKETFQKCVESFGSPSSTSEEQHTAHQHLIDKYLDDQYEVMRRLKPEVIGHFDLFRLFAPDVRIDEESTMIKVERNIQFAISYGALFECNAAAFRKGWTTSYPGADILSIILKYDGRLCLSDDSHGVHAVGLNYLRLRDYLIECQVDNIWYLEIDPDFPSSEHFHDTSFEPPTRFPRGTVARNMGPEWKTHPFWETFTDIVEAEASEQQ